MSNPALQHNIGSFLHGEFASTQRSVVNGAYVAATYITATGIVIDREDLPQQYRSGKLVAPFRSDLASGVIITVGGSLLHGTASGAVTTTLATFSEKTFANQTTATSLVRSDCFQAAFDLKGAKRFLKFKIRHKSSATATGVAEVTLGAAVAVFGGAHQTPASAT